MAQVIADVPGLVWKVWLLNVQDGEAGGIYLFQDEQSLFAYLSGPIIAQIKKLPQLRDISAKRFGTMPELTVVTSHPISSLAMTSSNSSFEWEVF